MEKHHLMTLMALMIIFGFIFVFAAVGLQTNHAIFGLQGIPIEFENLIIMILSLGSIVKIVYEIVRS